MSKKKKPQNKPKDILEALGPRAEETAPEPMVDETVTEALLEAKAEQMIGTQYPEGPPPIQPASDEARTKIQKAMDNPDIPSLPNPEKQETPASNTIPQPASNPSSPDSVPPQGDVVVSPGYTVKHTYNTQEDLLEKGDITQTDGGLVKDDGPIPPLDYKALRELEAQERDLKNLQKLKAFISAEEFSVNWCRLHITHISRIPNVIPNPILWNVPSGADLAQLLFDTVRCPSYVESAWPRLKVVMGGSIDNIEWTCGVLCTIALFDATQVLATIQEWGAK